MKNTSLARATVEINLAAARCNFRTLRASVAQNARFCCVVKANAYGHGAARLARIYEEEGADLLAVATAEEALSLRRAGIALPILVLGWVHPDEAPALSRAGVQISLFSAEQARAFSAAAARAGQPIALHIKVNTGMGRLGFPCDAHEEILAAARLPMLVPTGIFTHFATADAEDSAGRAFLLLQESRFRALLAALSLRGLRPPLCHASNSAAALACPSGAFDAVRVGIALYGISPFTPKVKIPNLRPILRLTAPVVHLFPLRAGETVGYGQTFRADSPRRIAVLPLGYADGLPRLAAERGLFVRIHGRLCRFVGRVCMDMATVDVTDVPVRLGDCAEIYGTRGETAVARVAARCGAIPYEITCALGERLKRVYLENENRA